LPELHPDLSTPQVLAMSFIDSQPIEAVAEAPQALRDQVARDLIDLVLCELFRFGLMQTDPNLANYRFDPASGRVVLLDFGAVMAIRPDLMQDFRRLLNAALEGSAAETHAAMRQIGYFSDSTPPHLQDLIQRMFHTAMAPLRQSTPFDFAGAGLVETLRDMGLAMGSERKLTHVPPPATLFLHRKIGGIYLLAAKLKARVALRPLVETYR
jgi:predicted unusual protein kinase regulating ubiquinone biosynthesis (AarF/ABC1/UbiB family)